MAPWTYAAWALAETMTPGYFEAIGSAPARKHVSLKRGSARARVQSRSAVASSHSGRAVPLARDLRGRRLPRGRSPNGTELQARWLSLRSALKQARRPLLRLLQAVR